MAAVNRERSERLEARLSVAEKALIDEAVHVLGQDRTAFVVSELTIAAQRVLADQEPRVLTERERRTWEHLNARPARALPGVAQLLSRPVPFTDR
jgi:uncharacterized protein (DUF1778 family)